MSFLIAVHVNEGIVLASDRRTTYTNTQINGSNIIKRIGVHTTDSTDKTFLCPNGSGISTCGDSSLMGKPITGFIQDVIRTHILKETRVEDIPQILIEYFNNLTVIPNTHFLVAGYSSENDTRIPQIFKVRIKEKSSEAVDTNAQGAFWDGEITTLTRLLQNTAIKTETNQYLDLPYEPILWEYFTLQDAVDFARYAVETTIQTMRFKNVVETVGGKVDILVITPDSSTWLQKEVLS